MKAAFGLRPPPVFFLVLAERLLAFFAVFFAPLAVFFAMLSSAPLICGRSLCPAVAPRASASQRCVRIIRDLYGFAPLFFAAASVRPVAALGGLDAAGDQLLQRLLIHVLEALDIETSAARLVLPQLVHQVGMLAESADQVEREVVLAWGESRREPV